MEVYELFVDDKDYDTQDGYTLLFHNTHELGMAVEAAVKNGFIDIRISKADTLKKIEYMKRLREQHPEMEFD